MIDPLINMMDSLVKQSSEAYKQNGPKYSHSKWKYCVALAAKGWEAYAFEPVAGESDSDDVVIKWRKEGEVEIKLRLSFTEQKKWIQYMEQKENDPDEPTKQESV